jgi:protein TonB
MPIGVSAVLHVGMIATALALRPAPKPTPPVMYKVELMAAPQGPVAAGTVGEAEPAPTPEPPAPSKSKAVPKAKVAVPSTKAAKPTKAGATPSIVKSTTKAPPGRAGSASGGEGTDVVGIKTDGISFPFPNYLNNIVRQIYLNFSPRGATNLTAEVFFMIRRDGSVANFRWLQRSGSQVFDLECQGAIEAAGKAFGPLPAGFTDDVLPVRFSFDPSKIR